MPCIAVLLALDCLSIDSIQTQFKLSQNKTVENINGVLNGLAELKTNDAAEMTTKVTNQNIC